MNVQMELKQPEDGQNRTVIVATTQQAKHSNYPELTVLRTLTSINLRISFLWHNGHEFYNLKYLTRSWISNNNKLLSASPNVMFICS
jgi:hypothetical protein